MTVYIVLGMLYESFIHPLTILSTLPSAGVGALIALALLTAGSDFDPHREAVLVGAPVGRLAMFIVFVGHPGSFGGAGSVVNW